MIMFSKKKTVW